MIAFHRLYWSFTRTNLKSQRMRYLRNCHCRWEGVHLSYTWFNRFPYALSRPVSQGAGEIRGFLERANYILDTASKSLADVTLEDTDKPGFRRFIKRVPLGVVLIIAPWKYVYHFPSLFKCSSQISLLAIRISPQWTQFFRPSLLEMPSFWNRLPKRHLQQNASLVRSYKLEFRKTSFRSCTCLLSWQTSRLATHPSISSRSLEVSLVVERWPRLLQMQSVLQVLLLRYVNFHSRIFPLILTLT